MKLSNHEKEHVFASTHSVEGWLSNHEALLLYELSKEGPGVGEIVEIGSYKGKSTIALALGQQQSKKKEMVWAIDPHEGVITSGKGSTHGKTLVEFLHNVRKAAIHNRVHPLMVTSKNAATRWNKPIRLLFLDGLHDYVHTNEDYQLWRKYVSRGIIAFHDGFCGEAGVGRVIREQVFANTRIIDIGTVTSILYIVLGRPTLGSKIRVKFKKQIVYCSFLCNRIPIPWFLKRIIIHGFFRLLLITPYTLAIY